VVKSIWKNGKIYETFEEQGGDKLPVSFRFNLAYYHKRFGLGENGECKCRRGEENFKENVCEQNVVRTE